MTAPRNLLAAACLLFWSGLLLGGLYGIWVARGIRAQQQHIFAPFHSLQLLGATAGSALLHGLLTAVVLVVLLAPIVALLTTKGRLAGLPAWTRKRGTGIVMLTIVLVSPYLLFRTGPATAETTLDPQPMNVVLIVVDALRADRLGCYGYPADTSPNLDDLCERASVYERAFVPYPATGPSFGSIFTAKYPRRHGLSAMDPRAWLGHGFNPTLAEVVSQEGFATAAIMTGSITRSSGLARGFQQVYEEMPSYALYNVNSAWESMRSRLPVSRMITRSRGEDQAGRVAWVTTDWIRHRSTEPFLLFVHLYEPHSPYTPAERHVQGLAAGREDGEPIRLKPMRSAYLRRVREGEVPFGQPEIDRLNRLYDAEVRAADESIGAVLQALDEQGLSDRTIVVVTADHGEDLFEHGVVEHGVLYNSNLHVPLVIFHPDRKEERFTHVVELIDLAPTLLGQLGFETPDGVDGVPLDHGERLSAEEPGYAFAEAECQSDRRGRSNCRLSIQDERWKLHHELAGGGTMLFDLESDPNESRDVADEHPEIVALLESRLLEWNAQQPDLPLLRQSLENSRREEIEQRLRSLGYID